MKFNEISTLLNSIYAVNAEGDTSVTLAPNLSNIVAFGKAIAGEEGFNAVWGRTAEEFVDKVKDTVILRTNFKHTGPDCFRLAEDWSGITEVYRVDVGEFTTSLQYDAVIPDADTGKYFTNRNTFDKLFGKELPTVKVRYYEGGNKYQKKITIAPYQFASAFASPSAMSSFIAEVERKISEQWDYAKECLEYMAMDAGLTKAAYDRTDLSADTSTSVILKEYTNMQELYTTIMNIFDDMEQYNNEYSASDYVSSVSSDDLVCYMRSDVYNDFISQLNDFAGYNKEAIDGILKRFRKIPMWQSRKARKDIVVDKATFDSNTTAGTKTVTLRNIEWAIFDKRLFACTADQKKVTSQYVANEDVTNYFHLAFTKYRLNEDLPCVICCDTDTLADALVIEA